MKKNNLLKSIIISFLIMILLSWVIVAGSYNGSTYSEYGLNPVGIFDIFRMPLICFATFIQYGILILSIGIFYGVLNKTGVYSKLIDKLVEKFKNKQKLFLILIICILCLLSSVTGLTLPLFILVPFLFSTLILLGHNKITAFAGTVGSILVGNICSLYGSSITFINNSLFGLNINKEIFVKIIFFLMVVFLFIDLVVLKKRKTKKEEKVELLFYEKSNSKKKIFPLVILGIITLIISILGMYNLKVFGVTIFTDIYDNLMKFEINGFHLFEKVFGGLVVFGSWTSYELSTLIIISSLVISWVYGLKFKDMLEGFKDGILKFYKIALYTIIANIVFTVVLNMGSTVMNTLNNFILGTQKDFSIIKTSLATLSGSLFYNDYSWMMKNGISNVLMLNDVINYPIIALILNAVFSLVMLIIPTSVLLVTGLKFTSIDYKDWIKYIWKYILVIFGLLLIISIILVKFL